MKKTIEIDVPDGYEYIRDNKFEPLKEGEILESRNILKKKETKSWDWYINKYFSKEELRNKYRIEDIPNIPFELKIGLLKFICDDLKIKVLRVVHIINQINEGQMISAYEHLLLKEIHNVCPKEFIDSLFT